MINVTPGANEAAVASYLDRDGKIVLQAMNGWDGYLYCDTSTTVYLSLDAATELVEALVAFGAKLPVSTP